MQMPLRTEAVHVPLTDSREVGLRLLDHIDAMVAYWDVDRICIFANNAYIARYGTTREEIIGISQERLLGPIYQRNLAYIEAAYAGNRQVFERELTTDGGHTHFNLISYIPDVVDGIVRGIFVHIADVTSLKEAESELRQARDRAEHMATHDFLTGLPNRALLEDRISHAIALSRRHHQMVAVMSLDVDNFKEVNDTWGHVAGDQLLQELAVRMRSTLRESDSATRMGGDEFLLLAPEIDSSAQVEAMATRLWKVVSQPVHIAGTDITPSFSVGIALFPSDGATIESLIAESDAALYTAKKRGKNCFSFADEKLAAATHGSLPEHRDLSKR
jgi:diguanylate cyclase (GGDEF)-like protein/PAS domain S-box-containing protein